MNLEAYAKHRKARGLRGTSHVAVLKAINDGRLTAPAVQRNGRSWIIDADLADQQWASRTDPSPVGNSPEAALPRAVSKSAAEQHIPPPDPSAKGLPALSVSKAVRAAYDAKLAQLQFQKETEELVPSRQVRDEAFNLARGLRDGLMRVADRVAPTLAATADARQVHHLLTEEIRVALRSLGDA